MEVLSKKIESIMIVKKHQQNKRKRSKSEVFYFGEEIPRMMSKSAYLKKRLLTMKIATIPPMNIKSEQRNLPFNHNS